MKLFGGYSPTQTPTQMLKSVFSIFSSQETDSSSVSLKMIFQSFEKSSTVCAIRIQDSFAGIKNPKIPGIEPKDYGQLENESEPTIRRLLFGD